LQGTQITAEDLFYNSLIRRNALRSSSEEFSKIFETVSRYAIHNYHASFFLKRANENGFDLKTNGISPQTTRSIANEKTLIENISIVFGSDLSKEVERIAIDYDDVHKFEMMGYMTNAKYAHLKQIVFILFINERLVDCQPLRKTLQALFALYMPKNTHPFVYLNIRICSHNLDVNVHPTKHEVRFLYQDEIISKIQQMIEQKLLNSNLSRTYLVKNLTLEAYLPSGSKTPNEPKKALCDTDPGQMKSPVYPYQLTRVDSRERTLDSYKHQNSLNTSKSSILDESLVKVKSDSGPDEVQSPLRKQMFDREIKLKSLNELREKIESNACPKQRKILSDFNFVGCLENDFALIQHQTGLFLANTQTLSQELFYQLACFNFGNFGYFRFNKPLGIFDLAKHALNDPESQWSPNDGDQDFLARKCEKLYLSKRHLLDDYFSIKISQNNDEPNVCIETLPMLLEDYVPDMRHLPMFILRMAVEVDWSMEKTCLKTICQELSAFYAVKISPFTDTIDLNDTMSTATGPKKPNTFWIIEHVLYPSFRNFLLPSKKHEDSIHKLVDLHDLYKVFERC
jgi:DNA mismatch repair protein MLH1